jgi:hypothetical protein
MNKLKKKELEDNTHKESLNSAYVASKAPMPKNVFRLLVNGCFRAHCFRVGNFIVTNSHNLDASLNSKYSIHVPATDKVYELNGAPIIDGKLAKFSIQLNGNLVPCTRVATLGDRNISTGVKLHYYSNTRDTYVLCIGRYRGYGGVGGIYVTYDATTEFGTCGTPVLWEDFSLGMHEQATDTNGKDSLGQAITGEQIYLFVYGTLEGITRLN